MRRLFRVFIFLLATTLFFAIVGVTGLVAGLWHYGRDLPDYKQLANYEPPTVTRIHAGDGRLIAEYARERRVFVPIEVMPRHLVQAFIAAEDQNFYSHPGVDFLALARAAMTNLANIGRSRRPVGASTITQQVAKNFLLTNEVSIERKIKEAILAFRIERAFSKDQILELYLNEIYLGYGSYGVAAAALNYFNKSMDELTTAEVEVARMLEHGLDEWEFDVLQLSELTGGNPLAAVGWAIAERHGFRRLCALDLSPHMLDECAAKAVRDLWRFNATHDAPALALANGGSCSQAEQSPAGERCVFEEDEMLAEALDVVATHDVSSPLFLFYSSHLVHMPLQAPQIYVDRFGHATGRVQQRIERRGHHIDASSQAGEQLREGFLRTNIRGRGVNDRIDAAGGGRAPFLSSGKHLTIPVSPPGGTGERR